MLIIKRKAQEVITIAPLEGIDTSRPIYELFEDGVIEIKLLEVGRRQVKVAIDAPRQLQIWRGRREPAADSDAGEEPAAREGDDAADAACC